VAAWRDHGCAATGAPYVIRGLLCQAGRLDSITDKKLSRDLAKTFLDAAACPASKYLSEADRARLTAIISAATVPR